MTLLLAALLAASTAAPAAPGVTDYTIVKGRIVEAVNQEPGWGYTLSFFLVIDVVEEWHGRTKAARIIVNIDSRGATEWPYGVVKRTVEPDGVVVTRLDPDYWQPGAVVVARLVTANTDRFWCFPRAAEFDADVPLEATIQPEYVMSHRWAAPELEKYRPMPAYCASWGEIFCVTLPEPPADTEAVPLCEHPRSGVSDAPAKPE